MPFDCWQRSTILVEHDRSDVIRFMKLLMNGGYRRNTRGGIVKVTCGGTCGLGLHGRRLDTICKTVFDAVIDLLYQQVFLPSGFLK